MINLTQLVMSGIMVGALYGLVAMGFVMIYRGTRVFNMAYGQFAVIGAYIAWTFLGSPSAPRLPLPLALFLTFLSSIAFGLLIEHFIFRRMIGRPLFSTFILSLGLWSILYGVALQAWGPEPRVFAYSLPKGPVNLGSVVLAKEYIWSFGLAVIILIAFMFFFQRTKLGLAIRASYDNEVAARCLGVNAGTNSKIFWVLCALLATLGGFVIASARGVSLSLGDLVMVVLAVALMGGLDSLMGCVVGGLILAIGENLAGFYLNSFIPGIGGIFGMILILLVLLTRPRGLFGAKPIERV
ncbi:MAG: branched-chain amino acid ABC transporter permease [Dehalococcoidales bacterium]|nr:branched-chain amino acid ABC transporter permease [Dehalococcoidales bacterium]